MKHTARIVVGVVVMTASMHVQAAEIERIGSDGDWSNASLWNPAQVPTSGDDVTHGASASDVVTYDQNVDPLNQTINSLAVVAGASRGLTIAQSMPLAINTSFVGSGAYVTELLQDSSVSVGGTITRGHWILGLRAQVDAGSIALGSTTEWTLNGGVVDVAGSVTSTASPTNDFTINSGGLLSVGGSATFGDLFVNAGGTADIAGTLASIFRITVDGGTLSAGAAGTGTVGVGHFMIEGDGSVTIDGELRLTNDVSFGSLEYGAPAVGDNTLTVGSLNFADSDSLVLRQGGGASLDLTVHGNVDVNTTGPIFFAFTPARVALTLDAAGTQDVEIFSTDYDVNGVGNVWFGVDICARERLYNARWIRELTVKSGATVDITDDVVNAYRAGYSQDALYVDGDVTVQSGATLNLGSFVLYYTGTLTEDGTINGTTQVGTIRCYGDFDADGDVDLDDYSKFAAEFTGAGNPADDALVDADLDTDVDLDDFSLFSENYTGAANPCPGACAESGSVGGEWTPGSLADWCLTHLAGHERERLAALLLALAGNVDDAEQSAAMQEIAELITE